MSDTPPENQSKPRTDEPGFVDGIPVEELVRLTREFTARITNEDRQRVAQELNESGHQRSIQSSAPPLLQQFFTGKVDLDAELARRYPSPPLLSSAIFNPEPGKPARNGFAMFSSQDNSAAMSIELNGSSGALNISFLLQSMIAVRFSLGGTTEAQRKKFLELIQRKNGMAFLWTHERWEKDYLIFVVRDYFVRMYAFGPGRFDGACRLTPDGLNELIQWLGGFWRAYDQAEADEAQGVAHDADDTDLPDDLEESPPDALKW
jgi:hypothetical protein